MIDLYIIPNITCHITYIASKEEIIAPPDTQSASLASPPPSTSPSRRLFSAHTARDGDSFRRVLFLAGELSLSLSLTLGGFRALALYYYVPRGACIICTPAKRAVTSVSGTRTRSSSRARFGKARVCAARANVRARIIAERGGGDICCQFSHLGAGSGFSVCAAGIVSFLGWCTCAVRADKIRLMSYVDGYRCIRVNAVDK